MQRHSLWAKRGQRTEKEVNENKLYMEDMQVFNNGGYNNFPQNFTCNLNTIKNIGGGLTN